MSKASSRSKPLSIHNDLDYQSALALFQAGAIDSQALIATRVREIDQLLKELAQKYLVSGDICVVAQGGYGRQELCPHSDIDVLLLTQRKANDSQIREIENFLYALWDTRLKIGHAVRSIADCIKQARQDTTIFTSLLDIRLVSGSEAVFAKLEERLDKIMTPKFRSKYIQKKLQERDERHQKYGDTRYVLEPNIKEGKGGLRDFQSLLWIAEVAYGADTLKKLEKLGIITSEESRRFHKAYSFLLTVRCHLHSIAGRNEERLHFDVQSELAKRTGYRGDHTTGEAVQRFMKHYFIVSRDIGDLTRIICASIESEDTPAESADSYLGFAVVKGRLNFGDNQNLDTHPIDILRLFRLAQQTGYDIHPYALRTVIRNLSLVDSVMRKDPLANRIFMEILTARKDAAQTLLRMNESGVLGRFIPDFGKIAGLMQFDRYHVFTVDQHTLHAIDLMHSLEQAPQDELLAARLMPHQDRWRHTLFVAILLHDICKGRGGDHSLLGAKLAKTLAPRLTLQPFETQMVSWLIEHHLLMSNTAFKRDIDDPETVRAFTRTVDSHEKLDLLTILTTVDIMAVGPGRWTGWKSKLIERLYDQASAALSGEDIEYLPHMHPPEGYKQGQTRIDFETDKERQNTRVSIFTPDQPGLFSRIAGGLAAAGANIAYARLDTLNDGTAADSFLIHDHQGKAIEGQRRIERVKESVRTAIENPFHKLDMDIAKAAPRSTQKTSDVPIQSRIRIDNTASESATVIEIRTRDRHGLLYDLACTLRTLGLNIRSAKVNTQGLKAIDVFYLQNATGTKILDPDHLKRIETDLLVTCRREQS